MLFKKIIKIIFWLCLTLTIVCLLFLLNLSNIVESQVAKRLPRLTDIKGLEFHVQKIGLFNTFVSDIHVGGSLSMDSLNIDYITRDLSSIHLSKVTVSGLNIHASLDENNQIQIQGLEFNEASKEQTKEPDLSFLSFLPEKIVFQNAKIILQAGDNEFLIPFEVLSTIRIKDEKIIAQAFLYPFGEKITAFISYDIRKGIESVKIEGNAFDSGHINSFISKKTDGVLVKGPIDFIIESSLPSKEWKLNVSRIGLAQPIETSIMDLNTIILIDKQKMNASGTFAISYLNLPQTPMEYNLALDLKNDLENSVQFDLNFKNRNKDSYEISHESILANIKHPQLNGQFMGTPLKSKGKISLSLKEGMIQVQKDRLFWGGTKIKSDISADFSDQGKGISSTFSINANHIGLKSDSIDSSFPLADISGQFLFDKEKRPSLSLTLKTVDGQVISKNFNTKASGINIEIPLQYPYPTKKLYGKYTIPTISYNNQFFFSTNGKILQAGSKEVKLEGEIGFKTLPHAQTRYNSVMGFEDGLLAALDFKIIPFKLNFSDIKKLVPQKLKAAEVDVTVSAEGSAQFLNHQLKTAMRLNINDGKIMIPDMNFTASGINTSVNFNDLLVLETVPGQMLTIDSIKVNEINFDDLKVRFSIEDASSLLVENITFKFCNGRVSTESVRFPQKNNTYALSFYCDRLELTQLLRQLGAFNAEGTGTLNGRIPVIYSDGDISFDNGFLFSTPGSGGKLLIDNTDIITAGIPMDSPQFVQLDLAKEALKEFDYTWAKLIFNTFEDTLSLNMELDGKPSKPLPFVYQKELGGFIRVNTSSPGSHFQGIKLDVNLKLPFNEMMKFGNTIKSILN